MLDPKDLFSSEAEGPRGGPIGVQAQTFLDPFLIFPCFIVELVFHVSCVHVVSVFPFVFFGLYALS